MITLLIGPNWTCPEPLLPLLTLTPHLVKISQNIYSSYWPLSKSTKLTSDWPHSFPPHIRDPSVYLDHPGLDMSPEEEPLIWELVSWTCGWTVIAVLGWQAQILILRIGSVSQPILMGSEKIKPNQVNHREPKPITPAAHHIQISFDRSFPFLFLVHEDSPGHEQLGRDDGWPPWKPFREIQTLC